MKPIIKICGLSTTQTINAAINAGADWIGLVNFKKSPRHVDGDEARRLAGHARGRTKIVSLVVNIDDEALDEIVRDVKPDIVQCHGSETPARILEIKSRYDLLVMKAIGISVSDDLAAIVPYVGIADHILLDAKPPKDADLPGGNGATFDWDILKDLPDGVPFMLSGGLSPDNVQEAIERTHPFGVDVSSGVESQPGVKDISMIESFIHAATLKA
ncbi:MAG: phosphoribosylanthranilate isomerase [Hyphomicrobiales bacterium]